MRPTELDARLRQLASALGAPAPNVLSAAPRAPWNAPLSASARVLTVIAGGLAATSALSASAPRAWRSARCAR